MLLRLPFFFVLALPLLLLLPPAAAAAVAVMSRLLPRGAPLLGESDPELIEPRLGDLPFFLFFGETPSDSVFASLDGCVDTSPDLTLAPVVALAL
jgi:hypothetical protein